MNKRRIYSEEFRLDALRLLESSGKTMAQIERDLGISQSLLGKWKQRYRVGLDKNSSEPRLERSELEEVKAENRRLKRELAIVQEEREILKKAISIFSDKRA